QSRALSSNARSPAALALLQRSLEPSCPRCLAVTGAWGGRTGPVRARGPDGPACLPFPLCSCQGPLRERTLSQGRRSAPEESPEGPSRKESPRGLPLEDRRPSRPERDAEALKASTLKASTLKASTLKASTLKASTLKASTLKASTLKASTLKASTLK